MFPLEGHNFRHYKFHQQDQLNCHFVRFLEFFWDLVSEKFNISFSLNLSRESTQCVLDCPYQNQYDALFGSIIKFLGSLHEGIASFFKWLHAFNTGPFVCY